MSESRTDADGERAPRLPQRSPGDDGEGTAEPAEAEGHLVAARRRASSRCVVALFPVVYIVSSAFNSDNTLQRRAGDPDPRDAAQLR